VGININIVAGHNKAASSVHATGSVRHVITAKERTTFRLGDKQLKDYVKAFFGKSPTDAYLHSPTKWHDLYERYSWPQVEMLLVVRDARILEITSQPVIVTSSEFANNSSHAGTFEVGVSDTVTNTTAFSWSLGGTLTIGQSLEVGIGLEGTGIKGEASWSYSQSWGIGGQKSKSITVGSSSSVSVELEPGEAIVATLSASRGVMKVRIRYNAYLIGSTAVNYKNKFKGHHFFSLPISGVMSKGGATNLVESTEDIEIGYYANSKIELTDKKTKKLKATHMLDYRPGV